MRVLVCGSRTFEDRGVVCAMLDGIRMGMGDDPDLVVIEGSARGADRLGREWAEAWGLPCSTYIAHWDEHGKAAGPIRNERMLEEGRPDIVVAFVDKPLHESRGTAHMVGIAREAGVKTIVVEVR